MTTQDLDTEQLGMLQGDIPHQSPIHIQSLKNLEEPELEITHRLLQLQGEARFLTNPTVDTTTARKDIQVDSSAKAPQKSVEIDENDPEQVILLQILEKMLSKHKVVQKKDAKATYTKFAPRQEEGIEEKLTCLDLESEIPDLQHIYKIDFIKQVKDHIKQVIETGREVKIPTLSRYLNQEKNYVGKCANMQIKLQQLKTSRPHADSRFLAMQTQSISTQRPALNDGQPRQATSPTAVNDERHRRSRSMAPFDF